MFSKNTIKLPGIRLYALVYKYSLMNTLQTWKNHGDWRQQRPWKQIQPKTELSTYHTAKWLSLFFSSWNINTIPYYLSTSLDSVYLNTGNEHYTQGFTEISNVQKPVHLRLCYFKMGWKERLLTRLGYIWNSPCRQVFSPECHFHWNNQDYPHHQPTCHLSLHSLEQLQHGDDQIPDEKGVQMIRMPESSDKSIPFQITMTDVSSLPADIFFLSVVLQCSFVAPEKESLE